MCFWPIVRVWLFLIWCMRNGLLLLVFSATLLLCAGQGLEKEPASRDTANSKSQFSCDSLNLKAQVDFQQAVRNYTRYSTVHLTEFRRFFEGYLLMRYKVKVIQLCTVEPSPRFCYSSSMNRCLEEELGKDFYVKAYDEAKLFYRLLEEE